MKTKSTKSIYWSVAIKVAVFLLLIFALYKQLYQNNDVKQIPDMLKNISGTQLSITLIVSFTLMLLNWGIEALKWKLLIQKINPIRLIRTFKAVWTGVTLGLFTPNRIGEFGGRILYVPRKFRIRAVIVSLIGSFSQNLATIITGMVSMTIFIYQIEHITPFVFFSMILIGTLAVTLLLLAYYNLDVVVQLFKRNKFLRRVYSYTEVLNRYHSGDYSRLLALSVLRYTVYTAQYLIFLRLYGAEITIVSGIAAIGVIYLAQTVVPSFAIVELITRGTIATLILSKYGVSDVVSLAATTSIWILNLILPAFLGYIFIIRYNFFKNRQS
ncbi:MAG: lysylphosphatidylglycerol synthase domain-containing protein [Chitinophagales bacterium]